MSRVAVENAYDDHAAIAESVRLGGHRDIVGGLWHELGELQLNFLTSNGLRPSDHLLDIGCGCLRGGVRFAAYLDPHHYWGLDSNQSLLDTGYDVELTDDLRQRVAREQLLCSETFEFELFNRSFDVAIAQSLFTHLPSTRIKLCLHRLAGVMKPGGRLFATYFEVPEDHPFDEEHVLPSGVSTWGFKDPFHLRLSELEALASGLPWRLVWTGPWGHPRDQRMAIFERLGDGEPARQDRALRSMDTGGSRSLAPGDMHYRSYVGPPDRFDFMSASQFALLFAFGLRDHHAVLDFGCGSLRLGRLLMPFLQAGRYYGIEPNRWLIEDALGREIGWSILSVKKPGFSYNDDFRCDVFGRDFDYVVAQSILTHCGPALVRRLLDQFAQVLTPRGIALFSVVDAVHSAADSAAEGWVYPECVEYREETILTWCHQAGFAAARLPWFHPGAVWYAAVRDATMLPTPAQMRALTGSVLIDPQFEASRPADA